MWRHQILVLLPFACEQKIFHFFRLKQRHFSFLRKRKYVEDKYGYAGDITSIPPGKTFGLLADNLAKKLVLPPYFFFCKPPKLTSGSNV